jgi:acetyl esterase/lipase
MIRIISVGTRGTNSRDIPSKRMNARKRLILCCAMMAAFASVAAASEPAIDVLRNRVYVERDSGPLAADIYRPQGAGPFPGILVVHGGAWRIGARADLAAIAKGLAQRGYVAVAIDYRLAPQYKFPAQIHDCQAAVRWMRNNAKELKIDPIRIGGFGYSAGGHLVALLGTLGDGELREPGVPAGAPSARLQVVVAGGAPCDFRPMPLNNNQLAYWLGGSRAERPDAYQDASPAKYITVDDPPMYFFSGDEDWLVPIISPKLMVASLKNAGLTAEMYTVKDAGHVQALFDRNALERGLAFADRYLKPHDDDVAAAKVDAAPSDLQNKSTSPPSNISQTGGGE